MSRITVQGAPKVILPHEIFERCMGWMQATDNEVSWRGMADWDEKEFRVKEVFLPFQNVTSGDVEVPTAKEGGDFGKWLTDCVRKGTYQNSQGQCRYKWHMHKHPGDDWGSLFESKKDEDNTSKFGLREIDWMIVGRAVPSGKFRICLEAFNPLSCTIDFLPVFVEYKGELYRISEPGEETLLEDLKIKVPGSLFYQAKEGKKNFAVGSISDIPIKHNIKKITPVSHVFSHNVLPEIYSTYYAIDYQAYAETSIETEKAFVLSSLAEEKPEKGPYCEIWKENGFAFVSFHFSVGPWKISSDRIFMEVALPKIIDIRKNAEQEVTEKVKVKEIKIMAVKKFRKSRGKTLKIPVAAGEFQTKFLTRRARRNKVWALPDQDFQPL